MADATVQALPLDLASRASVRGCVDAFHATKLPLHLLVNCAGQMVASQTPVLNDDGIEMTLAVNHVGHFLLTNMLLPDLVAAAPSRVVVVASRVHMEGGGMGPPPVFDFDVLDGSRGYSPRNAYKSSKLCNMWFAYELNRRVKGRGVCVLATCPGFVPETVAEHMTGARRLFMRHVLRHMPFARSLEVAAGHITTVATDPALQSQGGAFMADGQSIRSSDDSYDETKARRLWALTERLVGVSAS